MAEPADVKVETTSETGKTEDTSESSKVETTTESDKAETTSETAAEEKASDVDKEKTDKKEEESDHEQTEDEKKIISQIEYYFGDHNLGKDKFMQNQMKEDDGWIPFSVLLTFNRLKAITEDVESVVKAIKKSESDLLQVNDDGSKIRRNPDKPVPQKDNWKEEEWPRTAYVKGFPVDSSMDLIMDFFKNEGKVTNIFMRKKYHSKIFKGSVFVTFETKEELDEFLKKDGQKYKHTVLIKERRHDYQTRKHEEFTKRREDREKRKLEKQEKDAEEQEKAVADFNPEEDMKKDCLMKLTGFAKGTTREDIKEKLQPHGPIAYVDFKIGDEEAVVRFEESGIAKDVYEKSLSGKDDEKKLVIKDAEITATFPEGEEEIEYWKKIVRAKSSFNKERRNHKRRGGGQFGGRGGKGYRGGRGDFRGRGRGGGGGRGRHHQDRHEKNGDASHSGHKRRASDEAMTPSKKEKTDS